MTTVVKTTCSRCHASMNVFFCGFDLAHTEMNMISTKPGANHKSSRIDDLSIILMFSAILTTFCHQQEHQLAYPKPDLGSTTRPFLISNIIFQLSIFTSTNQLGIGLEIQGRHWLLKKACCQKKHDRPTKTQMGTFSIMACFDW